MPKDQPRIAIVHEYLTRVGGAERVAATLAEMFPEAPIYTLLYDREQVGHAFPPWRVKTSRLQKLPSFLRKRVKLLLPFLANTVESWDFSDYDIVISSSSAFTHGIITNPTTRHISYCHSPARFLWDWTHEYLVENRIRGLKKILVGSLLRYLREWNRVAAYRVDRWIANSATVAKRIKKYYRASADVVYPPVELERIRMSTHEEGYFLIVSQLTPYKKIDRAISVFNKLRRRLVIVGSGPQKKYLEAIAGPTVEVLGWKPDVVVTELLANCRGFIMPGEEDFGIAPIEAMAAGKPVIALRRGGATETVVDVGDYKKSKTKKEANSPTGVLFTEPSAKGLEEGLATFFANESYFRPTLIRAHAKKFSREIFEAKIRKVVAEEWKKLAR